jgi:hypothetical protein
MEEIKCYIERRAIMALKLGCFEKYVRNTSKILKCCAGESSSSSVGLVM